MIDKSVAAAITSSSIQPNNDRLVELRRVATNARDLELQIAEQEEQLRNLKSQLNELYKTTLPDLMDNAGVDHVGIPAIGNLPAMDFRMRPYYSANIAASWPQERKEIAFDFLTTMAAEDLIKTEVKAALPKGKLELAKKLVQAAAALKIPTTLTKSVHSGTLSAWLRELVEKHHTIPKVEDLEKIGGSIGRVVKPEERR